MTSRTKPPRSEELRDRIWSTEVDIETIDDMIDRACEAHALRRAELPGVEEYAAPRRHQLKALHTEARLRQDLELNGVLRERAEFVLAAFGEDDDPSLTALERDYLRYLETQKAWLDEQLRLLTE